MSEVNEMVQEVATAGVSRRHFVQGAAAVAAGAALPMTQILGGSSVSAAKASVLRIATQEQEGPASPWTTKGGSLIILGSVGEWLVDLDSKGGLVLWVQVGLVGVDNVVCCECGSVVELDISANLECPSFCIG